MKIVLQLTGPDGVSELVTIETGSNFTVPDGMTAELVSLEGVDDLHVEGGDLVLSGSGGTIRIAGLGADFLSETASIVESGIDGPLPDGFLRLFGWLDTPDIGSSNMDKAQGIVEQGHRAGDDDGLPPPLDSSNDGDTTTAPSAPVISSWSDDTGISGDGVTSDTTLTLSGTAEAGATLTLFDGGTELGTATAGSDGTWTFDTAALADGAHEFTATAANAGGTGAVSAPVTITVDTVAPDAPVISGYTADTGITGDGITSDAALTLAGTAEAGATVEIFDGAMLLGAVTADGAGAWSFTTSALDDSTHNFTATATDAAGNTGNVSQVFGVTIDTSAPAAPSIESASDDTGVSEDGITADTTLTLTGTAEAGSLVTIFDGGTELGTASADGAGAWSFTTGELADGAHEFTATATDAAGNTGDASDIFSMKLDTAAPAAPVISALSDDTGTQGDGITSDTTLTLTGTAEVGATVEIFDGATSLGTALADGAGAWSFTTATLADGEHNFTATQTDAAGNTGNASEAFTVEVDTTAPSAPVISAFTDDTGAEGDGVTSDTTLILTGTAEAGATVTIFNGATELGTALADGTGAWIFTTGELGGGAHSFTATAMDAAGNIGDASEVFAVEVDTTAPAAPIISGISDDSGAEGDGITADTTLTLTGIVEAGATVTVFDGETELGTAPADGTGAWSFTTGELGDGPHDFTATATDAAGNTGDASEVFVVEVDTSAPGAPVISGFSDDTGVSEDGITSDVTLVLTGTAEAGSTVTIFDGTTELGAILADDAGAWSFATGELSDGVHSFAATATDAAGNTGDTSGIFAVEIDTAGPAAPIVTGFSDDTGTPGDGTTSSTTLTLTGNAEGGATVEIFDGATSLGTALADDAGAWIFVTAELSDGTHDFTATATDAAGNTGDTSGIFVVEVDTAAPAAPVISGFSDDTGTQGDGITSDTTLTLTGTAEAGATVTLFDGETELGTAVANGAGAWTFTTATLADGEHNFTATQTDAAGNTGNASEAFTVEVDTSGPAAPVITGISDDTGGADDGITSDTTLTLTGTADAGVTITVFDGPHVLGTAVADGNGDWSFDTDTLTEGAHRFTATATDTVGNTGARSENFDVVVDTTPPAVEITTPISDDGLVNAQEGGSLSVSGTATGGQQVFVTFRDAGGATIGGSAFVDGNGDWSLSSTDISGLQNGAISIEVYAVDQAGNQSGTTAESITFDSGLPAAPVITGFTDNTGFPGDNLTSDTTPTLSGTAEAGTTVEIFDGLTSLGTTSVDLAGNWSFTTGTLAEGVHSLTARATDPAGNTGAVSAPLNLGIDTTAPSISIITPISGDGLVNAMEDGFFAVSGTSAGGQRVYVNFTDGSGATVGGTATVDGLGNWTLNADISGLDEGTITVEAYAEDQAGNRSDTVDVTIVHDSVAPATPVITGFSDDTGNLGDSLTSDNTIMLAGTAEAGSTVEIFIGVTSLGTVTADETGAWSFTTGELADGSYYFNAAAIDEAGNKSVSSDNYVVVVDTTPPGIEITTPISGDGLVNASEDNSLSISGTASGGQSVYVTFTDEGGATVTGEAIVAGGNWTLSGVDISGLADGEITVEAYAVDQAGNQSGTVTEIIGHDTVAPAVPVILGFSDDSGQEGDLRTNDTTPTLTGTAQAGTTVEIRDGAVLLGTALVDGNGNWNFTTPELAEGGHSLTVRALDDAGNLSGAANLGLTIDTTAHAVVITTPIATDNVVNAAEDGSVSVSGISVGAQRVYVTFRDESGTTVDGGYAIVVGGGSWTLSGVNISGLQNGEITVEAYSVDQAGNQSDTATETITLDNIAPAAPVIVDFSDDTGFDGDNQTADNTLIFTGTAEAGVTVNVYLDAAIVATGIADGDGNWTAATGTLGDGYSTFTARAVDAVGNQSGVSNSFAVIIDTEAPGAPTLDGYLPDTAAPGDGVTGDSNLLLSGTSPAGVSRIVIYDNGVEIGTVIPNGENWTFQTGVLDDGDHNFTAVARDNVGNESAETDVLVVTIDTEIPDAPVITGYSDDTGAIGDGVTADTTLTITGTAEANATISVFNHGSFLGTVTADANGDWSYDTDTLNQGQYSFTARAADVAGNISPMSDSLDVTISISVTPAPVIAGFSDDSGVQGDFLTNDATLTIEGTSAADATVEVFHGGIFIGATTADGSGNWSFTTTELADGTHVFQARATAPLSSTGPYSAQLTVTVDTTAPVVTISSPVDGDNIVGAFSDGSVTVSGSAPGGQQVFVTFRDGSGATVEGTAAVAGGGAWTLTGADISALDNGTITIEVYAVDAAGNRSDTVAHDIVLDNLAPPAPVIVGFSADTGTQVGSTSDTTLTFTGTAEANAIVQLFRGGGIVGTGMADGDGNWTITTGELSEGYASYEARALDAAGNVSGWSNNLNIDIDTTAPTLPAITGFSDDSGVQGDRVTNDTTLRLTGTGAAGSTVVVYDGGVELGTAQVDGGGTWSFTTAALADGEHSFTALARDGAGNESATTEAFDVTIDATRPDKPVITGYSDDTGNPDFQTSDNTLVLTGTAGAGETVNVYIGQTLVATGVADENGDWSAATGVIPDGFHYFYAHAVDAAGNRSIQSDNFVISVDTVPPAAPAITGYTNDDGVSTDDGISSFNWTYLSGTAAPGSSTVVIYRDGVEIGTAPANGGSWTFLVSALPEGAHTFTARARDFVGNESGESNAVQFTADLTPPAIPAIVSMSDDTGTPGDFRTSDTTPTFSGTAEEGATVTVRAGATVLGTTTADADGYWSYTAEVMAEGVYSITVKATDAAGRESSYSGTQIVVIDTTAPDAPVITGFSDDSLPTGDGVTSDTTPTLSGTAASNSTVEILSGGSVIGTVTSAANGTWSFTTEELAEGSYSFTARVTDNAGNISDESLALDLTIAGGSPPATATPLITLYSSDTGAADDGVTYDNTLVIYGTAANNATIEIFDGAASLGMVTADGAGNWSFVTATLSDGPHEFTVVATAPGGYGASDPSAALSVTIDTVAPATPVITGFSDNTGNVGSPTADNTLTFTGTSDAGVTVHVYFGGTIVATATADIEGNWSATTEPQPDGYAIYQARAVDTAGNLSGHSNQIIITVDTIAPDAPAIGSISPDTGAPGDGVTNATVLQINGTMPVDASTIRIYDNGVEIGTGAKTGPTSWVFTTGTLGEGEHEFTAVAVDLAGNESAPSPVFDVTIDATAPPVPVITAISEDTGSSAADRQTSDTTPTIIGTAVAGATVRVFVDSISAGTTVADSNGDWSFTTGELADGFYSVTARAEDAVGNPSAQTGPMSVLIDTTPPAITVTTPIAGDNLVNASEANFFNVSGTSIGGQTVYVTFMDELGATVSGTAIVNGTSWTLNGTNISGLQNGEITVEAYAVDSAGNQSGIVTSTIELDSVGPAAPVISGFTDDTGIANDQTSDTTPTLIGTAGANEEIRIYFQSSQIASTTADGDGNWTVTTPELPEGYHYLTARAVDDAGNLSSPSSIQIVWVDTTPPDAPTIDNWGDDTGTPGDGITDQNTIMLSGTRPLATFVNVYDNGVLLGTVPMTGDTWSFTTSVLPDGEHSFTVTAVDGAANESAPSAALDITIGEPAPEPFTAMTFAPEDAGGYVAEGTSGDDTFYTPDANIESVIGGDGYDTLTFAALDSQQTLDLTLIGDSAIQSVEHLHAGTPQASLMLEAKDVLAMSDDIVGLPGDEKTRLTVTGAEGSSVSTADTGWSFQGSETDGDMTFNIFGNGTAQLYVQDTMDAGGTLPAVA